MYLCSHHKISDYKKFMYKLQDMEKSLKTSTHDRSIYGYFGSMDQRHFYIIWEGKDRGTIASYCDKHFRDYGEVEYYQMDMENMKFGQAA